MASFLFQIKGYRFELRLQGENGFDVFCSTISQDTPLLMFDLFNLRPAGASAAVPADQIQFHALIFDAGQQTENHTGVITYSKTGVRIAPGPMAAVTRGHNGQVNFITDPQFVLQEEPPCSSAST